MAYIGVQPADAYTSFAVQHFTTSATTSYTLDHSVANENEIALFINNVRQQPGSSYAYTASGTTLTLSAATSASDTMYCVFIGKAVQTVTPASGSVTNDMLAGSIANAKLANSSITLNGSAVSLGGSATVDNTPAFFVIKTPNQSVSAYTSTKVTFNSEKFDSNNKFDTSTSRFTPATAGQYFLIAQIHIQAMHNQATTELDIKKNGSYVASRFKHIALNSSDDKEPSLFTSCIVESDTDDYFEVITHTDMGGGTTITGDASGFTFFGGYKIIT